MSQWWVRHVVLFRQIPPLLALATVGSISLQLLSMIMRHQKVSGYQSTQIGARIDGLPTLKDSPYFEPSQIVWDMFIRNHIIAPPPLAVSRKIAKIIQAKNPKIHYSSGAFLQTKVLPALKSFLPGNSFQDLVAKVLGL